MAYGTFEDPFSAYFFIFLLWRPVTSVKMNNLFNLIKMLCVWMSFIEWYLNWPFDKAPIGLLFPEMVLLLVDVDIDDF